MIEMTKADAIEQLPSLLSGLTPTVVITEGGSGVCAIVSMEDYEVIRRAKAERFLKASEVFGEHIRQKAAEDGLTPEDVLKILDRKAS